MNSSAVHLKADLALLQRPAKPSGMPKGQQTRATILDAAVHLASQTGLESLSIGALADATGMSKSGVFAHFGSREELQISVIREYHERFKKEVFTPAMSIERGLPRLMALFELWIQRTTVEVDSGCIYISGAVEFDDRDGPVRDALTESVQAWQDAMKRALITTRDCAQLSPDADIEQMLFEIHGLILALHYEARFLKRPGSNRHAHTGFRHILTRYGADCPDLVFPLSTLASQE